MTGLTMNFPSHHSTALFVHYFICVFLIKTITCDDVSFDSESTSARSLPTRRTRTNSSDCNISSIVLPSSNTTKLEHHPEQGRQREFENSSRLLSSKALSEHQENGYRFEFNSTLLSQISGRGSRNEPYAGSPSPTPRHQRQQYEYKKSSRAERHSFTKLQDSHYQTTQKDTVHNTDPSPGDNYKVDLRLDQTAHFPIDVEKCGKYHTIPLQGTSGIVYLVNNKTSPADFSACRWSVTVPKGQFLAARFDSDLQNSFQGTIVKVSDGHRTFGSFRSNSKRHKLIYSPSNFALFSLSFNIFHKERPANATTFYLLFTSVSHEGRRVLPVVMTSSSTGYVTSAGFGGDAGYADNTHASYDLIVSPDHVVMISCPRIDLREPADISYCERHWDDHLELTEINDAARGPTTVICGNVDFRPRIFNTSLALQMVVVSESKGHSGFKIEFSFHPVSDAPSINDEGLLNCSVPNYNAFKQHVQCNLARDCVDGEDEGGHCPFSSRRCNGSVALRNKCYMSFQNKNPISWNEANQGCKSRGGILAGMRTTEEKEAVESIFKYSRWWLPAWVGLRRTDSTVPHMYWKMWQWKDDVMEYSADIDYSKTRNYDEACAYIVPQLPGVLFAFSCTSVRFKRYVCEFQSKKDRADKSEGSVNKAATPDLTHKNLWVEYPVTKCLSGHVTFSFLSCDPASDCGTIHYQASCKTVYQDKSNVTDTDKLERTQAQTNRRLGGTPSADVSPSASIIVIRVSMFSCGDGQTSLHYSLVCDYIPNCPDKSDEAFCNHGDACLDLTCNSGQCFSFSQKCDKACDCFDCSDEPNFCPPTTATVFFKDITDSDMKDDNSKLYLDFIYRRQSPPTIIDFDKRGSYSQRPIKDSDPCPETHVRCPRVKSHCLPVHVRCNGVYDCPNHADEEDCDRYDCPGFYRCRGSRACVHADHMCDGWSQCPGQDDELYCGLTCPPDCLCQGMAFVCSVKFVAHGYPKTRYLDASRSEMKPADLLHNMYLIWLKMAYCSLGMLSDLSWPNLIHLDFSHNDLSVVSMDAFLNLPNLRTLILAENPLISLLDSAISFNNKILNNLDLSKTMLREFNGSVLSCYPHITKLNISYSPVDRISETGFNSTPYLVIIDLSGSPVTNFPADIFKRSGRLERVFAANYKLCCKVTLPETFDERLCFAPQDEISSCEDLLRSNAFRGFLWMFGVLAFSGNLACFLVRYFSKERTPRSGFNMFVTNLTVADFLMGVYLMIVGVADVTYLGQYVWYEISWRNSEACAVAGFLSFLSSEMSAFIICLITLDRFLVLTFPFADIRFKGHSAAVTCGLVWIVGATASSVPFFPRTPRWEFYGQTGICIPLPITRGSFPGHSYAFGVMIVLNFILFLLIAAGQAAIYWSVRLNSMSTTDSGRKSQDLVIARRLITVAVSDFLCWFPIGFLGLLSFTGVPVSSHANVAMAIFILPLNSAINPFLYTFNVVMERRRKAYEAQLAKVLEKRILSQKPPAT